MEALVEAAGDVLHSTTFRRDSYASVSLRKFTGELSPIELAFRASTLRETESGEVEAAQNRSGPKDSMQSVISRRAIQGM